MPDMALAGDIPPGSLIERVIRALAANNPAELEELLRIAEEIQRRGIRGPEAQFDESGMRLLSALLAETSRNLRLLKRAGGCKDQGLQTK